MLISVLISVFVAWIVFAIGFTFIKTPSEKVKILNRFLWNSRIDKLSLPPFAWFLKAYENKNFIKSAIFILLLNLPIHILMFFSGYIKIGLIMIIVPPFLQGAIVGMGDDKTRLHGVITSVFEVSGFVISCSLGFWGKV